MDFILRKEALARLADSSSDEALRVLRKEFNSSGAVLRESVDYEALDQSLALLHVIAHRFSDEALTLLESFVATVESRPLTHPDSPLLALHEYRTAAFLIGKAIDVAARLRYLETRRVLHFLLNLSTHDSERVRASALDALKALAQYDLRVFWGDERQPGIGAQPQVLLIQELSRLPEKRLRLLMAPISTVCDALLSPTMEGTSWTYRTMTLSRADTPARPDVDTVRTESINLLARLFRLSKTPAEKRHLVTSLRHATHTSGMGQSSDAVRQMYIRHTLVVLDHFAGWARTEELPVLQKLEHETYWIFFHRLDHRVGDAALRVKAELDRHAEYQIYKTLVGFEGVFGDWLELSTNDRKWERTDDVRRSRSNEYVERISEDSYQEWATRILSYAKTESDDLATFPIFHYFLEHFATAKPDLAIRLVTEDTEAIAAFLVPLLRGLWGGPKSGEIRQLAQSWVAHGRYLVQLSRLFLSYTPIDIPLLKSVLEVAASLEQARAVTSIVSVAVSNYDAQDGAAVSELFLPAIRILTRWKHVEWVFDAWYRRELHALIGSLGRDDIEVVVESLSYLDRVDYHAEEVLYAIAKQDPERVLRYLLDRIAREAREGHSDDFEALPHQFHKLNEPLSVIPDLVVEMVRQTYDGNYGMFIYRGARLVWMIFPIFGPAIEQDLLRLASGNEHDREIVLAVLRNYQGEPAIHEVCKTLIKAIAPESDLKDEIAIVLESTGVVMGEYGLAEAYERKKGEVSTWLTDPDLKIQQFAAWYINGLDRMIARERQHASEEIALRKFRYGTGSTEE